MTVPGEIVATAHHCETKQASVRLELSSSKVFVDLAISLPALFAGSALGVIAFHRVNETVFRKTVLVFLLVSGISPI
ncbi:hypothetical protein AC629_05875 [Bradyrhizobium sp. NAS80.1]|nr:hypothetical protein [Bradyrhizobium sp. NAS80.1]OKO89923.1 hypothetical protein AC629_05875 [Bradyrhizobium sp. NAS80.1]